LEGRAEEVGATIVADLGNLANRAGKQRSNPAFMGLNSGEFPVDDKYKVCGAGKSIRRAGLSVRSTAGLHSDFDDQRS
jgi:hypothetical protein